MDSNRQSLVPALSIYLALAALLLLMGRTLWCSCGSLLPWSWVVASSHNSQHFIDWYSFSHLLHGFIFYWLLQRWQARRPFGIRLTAAMLLESAWELLENSPLIIERYRSATMALNYYGDSVLNSVGDLSCCVLGFFLAQRFSPRVSVALVLAVELIMLAIIRDNLTLNVLMLLWPIDAIKHWQAG